MHCVAVIHVVQSQTIFHAQIDMGGYKGRVLFSPSNNDVDVTLEMKSDVDVFKNAFITTLPAIFG